MAAFNDVHAAAVRRAHELGVTIAMGTDAGTPGNHHGMNAHECVFLVEQCGLTPAESIASATVDAARLLRQPDLGSLHEGASPTSSPRAATRSTTSPSSPAWPWSSPTASPSATTWCDRSRPDVRSLSTGS